MVKNVKKIKNAENHENGWMSDCDGLFTKTRREVGTAQAETYPNPATTTKFGAS